MHSLWGMPPFIVIRRPGLGVDSRGKHSISTLDDKGGGFSACDMCYSVTLSNPLEGLVKWRTPSLGRPHLFPHVSSSSLNLCIGALFVLVCLGCLLRISAAALSPLFRHCDASLIDLQVATSFRQWRSMTNLELAPMI
jgi:hypothetical protein